MPRRYKPNPIYDYHATKEINIYKPCPAKDENKTINEILTDTYGPFNNLKDNTKALRLLNKCISRRYDAFFFEYCKSKNKRIDEVNMQKYKKYVISHYPAFNKHLKKQKQLIHEIGIQRDEMEEKIRLTRKENMLRDQLRARLRKDELIKKENMLLNQLRARLQKGSGKSRSNFIKTNRKYKKKNGRKVILYKANNKTKKLFYITKNNNKVYIN